METNVKKIAPGTTVSIVPHGKGFVIKKKIWNEEKIIYNEQDPKSEWETEKDILKSDTWKIFLQK